MGKSDDARWAMTCHYEAGRALAHGWGGIEWQEANLPGVYVVPLASEMGPAGAGPDALDRFLTRRPYPLPPSAQAPQTPERRAWVRMEVALVACYAGAVAWARHRRRTVEECLSGDGRVDAERAHAMSTAFFAGKEQRDGHSAEVSRASALVYATKLVRSYRGWAAVSSIAEGLDRRGRLEADEIDALCHAVFRARPLPPGWDPHWPPCHDDLDDGCMPHAFWPWYWDENLDDRETIRTLASHPSVTPDRTARWVHRHGWVPKRGGRVRDIGQCSRSTCGLARPGPMHSSQQASVRPTIIPTQMREV